jgi:GT2 family glycosyltransferase
VKPDVVIPTWRARELLARCLSALHADPSPKRVIVVDNASADGTAEFVRSEHPEVTLVELPKNMGFARAVNAGVRAGQGEAIVLLNNDVECPPEFLERLVAPFDDPGLGSAAALLLTSGERHIESFGLAVDPTLAGYPRLRGLSAADAQAETPILLGPSGAAGAYRRRAWDDVGGLDEGVRFYGEDVDLAARLRAAGWTTTAVATAVAVHLGSATASHRSARQRYEGGFARGYFLRRYGVLRSRSAPRAVATEALVVLGDAIAFSHDLEALRGRLAGWRAARGRERVRRPPDDAVDRGITFVKSLRLRVGVYTEARTSS